MALTHSLFIELEVTSPRGHKCKTAVNTDGHLEIVTSLDVDCDGAPTCYGPSNLVTLDYELNAHSQNPPPLKESNPIVGYLTYAPSHRKPILQTSADPAPGYYISTTSFTDPNNPNETDPRRYVNASVISYVVLARIAQTNGAKLGDFVAVYSFTYQTVVYGIIGDGGNSSGAEGSLALLNQLGYTQFHNAKSGGVVASDFVIRYFPNSNAQFFLNQADLNTAALSASLDTDFRENKCGMIGASKIFEGRQACMWHCRGMFAFASLLLTVQTFSRAADPEHEALVNGISPNGRYFITTSVKRRKIEGDFIPEVLLFLNDRKSDRELGELCGILQLNPIADSTRNIVLTWSKDSKRLALYLHSSHAHSFLFVYMIGEKGFEKARLPSNIGYNLASIAAHWQPAKSFNDIAWSTFAADDFVWLDDRDLSLHAHYEFDELGASIVVVGRLLEQDSGWTFKADKVQLE